MTDVLTKNAQTSLVIVDTGCANITSVYCAIERLGCRVSISSDAAVIQSADKVIIPGVGTASQAMANMKNIIAFLPNAAAYNSNNQSTGNAIKFARAYVS